MMKKIIALILLLTALPWASIELIGTTDSLVVTTGSAVTVDVHADWADNTTTTFAPSRLNTLITTAATTKIVPSPAASTQRTVKSFTIHNKHNSSSNLITVTLYDGTTTATILAYTLLAGETIVYNGAADYYVLDVNFAKKITAAIGPGTNNTVAKFNSGTQIGNSKISDDGTTIKDSVNVQELGTTDNFAASQGAWQNLGGGYNAKNFRVGGTLTSVGASDSMLGNLLVGKSGTVNRSAQNFSLTINGGLSGDSTSALELVGHRTGSTVHSQISFYDSANEVARISSLRKASNISSDLRLYSSNTVGSVLLGIEVDTGQTVFIATALGFASKLAFITAPTISSGFGSSPSISGNNGTAAFEVNVGTGGSASSGVIGLPTASTGWNCYCTDITTSSATVSQCKQTASSTTTATIGNFTDLTVAAAWAASDKVRVSCFAY